MYSPAKSRFHRPLGWRRWLRSDWSCMASWLARSFGGWRGSLGAGTRAKIGLEGNCPGGDYSASSLHSQESYTMGMIKEFRDFAMRGNVADMAVGIIIGGAFQKIVTSLVDNIVMPP